MSAQAGGAKADAVKADEAAKPEPKEEHGESIKREDVPGPEDVWDVDAWAECLHDAQSQPIEQARPVFERFFSAFPTAARYWKVYAEKEMESNNPDRADDIFKRCLHLCMNIELWKTYLQHVASRHGVNAAADAAAKYARLTPPQREAIDKSFTFTLENMGQDMGAAGIWHDYIAFLQSQTTASQYEERDKIDTIRAVFCRAVQVPMHGVEGLWKDYEEFETQNNKSTSKILLSDLLTKHQFAKQVFRDRKAQREGLQTNMLSRPIAKYGRREEDQHARWRKLIAYERKNPQHLSPDDHRARVMLAFRQCLLCFYHYPDVWYEACTFLADEGQADTAARMFDLALTAVPNSLVLHFAFADFEESRKNLQKAKDVFEGLIATQPSPLVFIQYQRLIRRGEGMEAARKVFLRARKCPQCADSFQLIVASALMEFHTNKREDVARKVFELGLQKFASNPEYVQHYVDFLYHLNDHTNIREVFERVLSNLDQGACQEVWARYMQFEYMCGSVNSIRQLERRWMEAVKDQDGALAVTLRRFRFMDLWPCAPHEVGLFESRSKVQTQLPPPPPRQSTRARRPDTSQMTPYTSEPQVQPPAVPAVVAPAPAVIRFAIDPELEQFLRNLPPARQVPLDVGYVLDVLSKLPSVKGLGLPKADSAPPPQHPAPRQGGRWAKRKPEREDDVEDEGMRRGQATDIFRHRQRQKMSNS